MGRTIITLAAAGTAVAVALSGGTAAARHGCASEDRDVVVRTGEAVVFTKGSFRFGNARRPFFYGCDLRRGTIRRLNHRDDIGWEEINPSSVTLSGRFVAYTEVPNQAGAESGQERVAVVNLTSGALRQGGASGDVSALVLRRDGASNHITTIRNSDGVVERIVVGLSADGEARLIDRDTDIAPRSLALSDDRRTIFWLNGGEARSASSG